MKYVCGGTGTDFWTKLEMFGMRFLGNEECRDRDVKETGEHSGGVYLRRLRNMYLCGASH
jgi:hypothetical protein